MLVSTTSSNGCGGLPGAYAGVFYAVQNGADVVSMSF